MNFKKNSSKHLKFFILTYFLLWVVLFEFIIPPNQFLPKPSIVILSFSALWKVYNLPVNFVVTISAIYFSMLSAYWVIYILRNFLIKHNHILSEFIFSLNFFSEYIPGIIIGMFLIFWFPFSNYIEFLFAFGTSFFSLLIKLKEEVSSVGKEYIDSAKSLGAGDDIIRKKIIWNAAQPGLIRHLFDLHLYLWTVMIVFEYIKGRYGLGNIFRTAMRYEDLSALFTGTLIVGATVYLGIRIIVYIRNKFFSWSVL